MDVPMQPGQEAGVIWRVSDGVILHFIVFQGAYETDYAPGPGMDVEPCDPKNAEHGWIRFGPGDYRPPQE